MTNAAGVEPEANGPSAMTPTRGVAAPTAAFVIVPIVVKSTPFSE